MDEFIDDMPPAKAYTYPVRAMTLISIIVTFLAFANSRYISYAAEAARPKLYFFLFLWPVVIIAEGLVYWFIRKKIKSNINVWMHLGATFTGFILLNVVFILINLTVSTFNVTLLIALGQIHTALFWLSLIVGQAFFVAVLVKAFRKKVKDDDGQPPGILDGIMEEE